MKEPDLDEILKSLEEQQQYSTKDHLTEQEKNELNHQMETSEEAILLEEVRKREEGKKQLPDKVLVIDDSKLMRRNIGHTLKRHGNYIVDEAGTSADAIDLLNVVDNYKIVTLDLNMPGGSGMQVLDEIQNKAYQTKVIVISTENEKETISRALLKGACSFITKPFNQEKLLQHIHEALSSS